VVAKIQERWPEWDPLTEMVKLAEMTTDPELKLSILKEVIKRWLPELKSVAVSGSGEDGKIEHSIKVSFVDSALKGEDGA